MLSTLVTIEGAQQGAVFSTFQNISNASLCILQFHINFLSILQTHLYTVLQLKIAILQLYGVHIVPFTVVDKWKVHIPH